MFHTFTASNYILRDTKASMYRQNLIFPKKKEITFRVRGCKQATLLMTTSATDIWGRNLFEIILDEESLIRYHQSPENVASAATPSLLDCDRCIKYWISWENSQIQVGSGDLRSYPFLSWNMPIDTSVQSVSMDSPSDDIIWEIDQQES